MNKIKLSQRFTICTVVVVVVVVVVTHCQKELAPLLGTMLTWNSHSTWDTVNMQINCAAYKIINTIYFIFIIFDSNAIVLVKYMNFKMDRWHDNSKTIHRMCF